MQVRLNAGFLEDLVDERAVRVAVAIDDGHLVEADALGGPAHARARRLPDLAHGIGRAHERNRPAVDRRGRVLAKQRGGKWGDRFGDRIGALGGSPDIKEGGLPRAG